MAGDGSGGVSIHAARVWAPTPWAPWQPDQSGVDLAADLERGAAQFAGMALDVVVIAQSSSSIAGGEGWDARPPRRGRRRRCPAGRPSPGTAGDCVATLPTCDVERPSLVFPPWFSEESIQAGIGPFSAGSSRPPAASAIGRKRDGAMCRRGSSTPAGCTSTKASTCSATRSPRSVRARRRACCRSAVRRDRRGLGADASPTGGDGERGEPLALPADHGHRDTGEGLGSGLNQHQKATMAARQAAERKFAASLS